MDALSNLKSVWKASKNAILNIPEIEQKVMEATNNEKWGPTGQQMNEIAKATYSYNDFPIIMELIWKRLAERVPTDWRHVYKSLLLLEHLLRNGSDQVITETRVHVYALERLSSYTSFEEGKDNGLSVRERAKAVLELVTDERRIKDEREKASANRKKFQSGISSEDYRGGYGGGYGNNSYPSYEDPYGDNGAPKATKFDYNFSSNNSQYNQTSQPPPIASISTPPVSNSPSIFDGTGEESSSSDSDDDFIPREAAQAASRPRAPSGGSSTPKVQDLLGLGFSSPSSSSSSSSFNSSFNSSSNSNSSSFNPQFTAQFDQPQQSIQQQPLQSVQSVQPSFDFFSSQPQQPPQQQPQQPPQVQSSMLSFAAVQSQPPTPSPQPQSPAKPSSPAPSSPSVDDKDPWKKAANLFDLDSITDEISKPKAEYSTTPQGYGNIRQLQGQNPYNAINNSNNNNNMNNNMGRGAPIANFNQFANPQFGNPNMGNPQFGNPQFANPQFANPQFANPQFGNPQFGNPQFANPQFANPQFANPQFNPNMGNMNMNMNGMNGMNNMMGGGAPSNPNAFW